MNEKSKNKLECWARLKLIGINKNSKKNFQIISGNEKEFIDSGNTYSAKKKRIILFYLGGITFAEIAAIEHYNKVINL